MAIVPCPDDNGRYEFPRRRGVRRLPQPRLDVRRNAGSVYCYDPTIESAGLTLDTARGPVDLVAVRRALRGELVPLTCADVTYILDTLPVGEPNYAVLPAAGLGVTEMAVKRAVVRRNAALKAARAGLAVAA